MSEIRAALTKEEWQDPNSIVWGKASAVYPVIDGEGTLSLGCDDDYYHEELSAEQRLALGALCLHGQPSGFKRWMVEWLRDPYVSDLPTDILILFEDGGFDSVGAGKAYVNELIAKVIEALLPPEGGHGERADQRLAVESVG